MSPRRSPLPIPFLLAFAISALPAAQLDAQDYYSDVRPVLVQNCLSCHTAEGPGWSMEDAEATLQRRHMIVGMMLERMMPPWIAEGGHQTYLDDASLDPAVLDMMRSWRDGGFAVGQPRPDPAPEHAGHHQGFQPDVTLDVLPDGSYLPDQSRPDDYRCFVVEWMEDEPRYVTGFRAVPGNLQVAHHVVVHAVTAGMLPRYRELEAAEEGAGYQCFGGALPDRLGQRAARDAYEAQYPDGVRELNRSNFWLAHWAPGMDGHQFPQGTGILMEPGSALVVQMHYYGGQAPGQQDAGTVVDFQLAEHVDRPAFHLPQTFNPWLASERNRTMVIEPGEMATFEVADDLGALLPYIARVTQVDEARIRGLEIHSVNLHMHAFGHSGIISLTTRAGRKETLLSVPRWDLRWQRDFVLAEPKIFQRQELTGTRLAVQCTFRNNRTETVYGGYGSFDEMCFNFSYIAVQQGDPPGPATGSQP